MTDPEPPVAPDALWPSSGAADAPAGEHPRFSIVIPIHNEAECLADEGDEVVDELEARGGGVSSAKSAVFFPAFYPSPQAAPLRAAPAPAGGGGLGAGAPAAPWLL